MHEGKLNVVLLNPEELVAQWEIRAMAIEMLKLAKSVAPTIFKGAGPGCVVGECQEGKMSCGKMDEVRSRFR